MEAAMKTILKWMIVFVSTAAITMGPLEHLGKSTSTEETKSAYGSMRIENLASRIFSLTPAFRHAMAVERQSKDPLRRATFPVLTPEAAAAIASALQDALEPRNVDSFEKGERLLKEYLERIKLIVTDPNSFLGNVEPDFFNTPKGAAVQDAMEAIADVATTQIQQFDISDCDKAAIEGFTAITVGALFGGPAGAVAGFLGAVVHLALECSAAASPS
jgi:hypothetical protein